MLALSDDILFGQQLHRCTRLFAAQATLSPCPSPHLGLFVFVLGLGFKSGMGLGMRVGVSNSNLAIGSGPVARPLVPRALSGNVK